MHFKSDEKRLCQSQHKLSDWILGNGFNFSVVSLALQCVRALEFRMTIKINEMTLMHFVDTSSNGDKTIIERPHKCYSTLPLCTTTTTAALPSYCHFAHCAMCTVQCAMCAFTSKQLIFYSLRWHSHYYGFYCYVQCNVRSLLNAVHASLRLAERKRTWKQQKKEQQCEQISVRLQDESFENYLFERCVSHCISRITIATDCRFFARSLHLLCLLAVISICGCHIWMNEHRRDWINYSSNRLIIVLW